MDCLDIEHAVDFHVDDAFPYYQVSVFGVLNFKGVICALCFGSTVQ